MPSAWACATQDAVFEIFDEGARAVGQSLRCTGRPEQEVGVEEDLHSPPSNSNSISSAPMRSKSPGTEICPARNPVRRAPDAGASRAMTLTIRFARAGDDERLSVGRSLDETREVGLGFVHVDGTHGWRLLDLVSLGVCAAGDLRHATGRRPTT